MKYVRNGCLKRKIHLQTIITINMFIYVEMFYQ